MLLLADLYYQRLSLCGCRGPLSEEALMELFPKLRANISTGISKVLRFCGVFSSFVLCVYCQWLSELLNQKMLLWGGFCLKQ